jgi:pyruvate kinase
MSSDNNGPELRGANITLEKILAKTDTSKRQTKIVCTMGPSCWDVPCLEDLIDLGLSVTRFNFSHGDHEGHKACLDRVRQAAANKKKHVGKFCFDGTSTAHQAMDYCGVS